MQKYLQVHISESTFIYTLNLYIYVLSIYLAIFLSFCQSPIHLCIYDLSYLFYPFPNSYYHLKLITHEVMMSSTSFTVSFQPGPKYNLSSNLLLEWTFKHSNLIIY